MARKLDTFTRELWSYYNDNARQLPWRQAETNGAFDPYKIMVSEIMLQQTQVSRVITKYQEFLIAFPTINLLAQASLAEVLKIWSGLGYNRRAKFLHQAAQIITAEYDGKLPNKLDELIKLPGIGKNTAGAILAYAFNLPFVFIETNIRTVYLHHFFNDQTNVDDTQLIPYIQQTIDKSNPRKFYWALMDYGSHLKSTVGNVSKNSKHYSRQSIFEGSLRQLRGKVLRSLGERPKMLSDLMEEIEDERIINVVEDLKKEQLITHQEQMYYLG